MENKSRHTRANRDNEYRHRNRIVNVPDGYMAVGLVVNVHGMRGEVKVEPHTDFSDRFKADAVLFGGEELLELKVLSARPHKGHILITFDGVNSRNEAENLRNLWLFIDESDANWLDEDTYWIHDLIGLQVLSAEGIDLGRISDVMATGANDVYIVQPAAGINQGKELLLPAIADVVLDVNIDDGVMTVQLIPGLLAEE